MESNAETIDQQILQLKRSIVTESFHEFFLEFWEEVCPEILVDNWHIKYLCDELQIMAERVFLREPSEYDLIINVAPGSSKSKVCSVMFPAWCWTRDASIQALCASYSYSLQASLGSECKAIIESEKFRAMFPELTLRDDTRGKGYFKLKQGGYRYATGTGGTITGFHGHFLIVDDPINPEEAVSSTGIRNVNQWLEQTFMSRKVDKDITPLILIMQRLHQDDPTAFLLNKAAAGKSYRVKHICLPAQIDTVAELNEKDPEKWRVRPRELIKHYSAGLFDPVRLSERSIMKMREQLGQYASAGQLDQNPVPAGGGMFKVDQFVPVDYVPSRIVSSVRYWDKAGTEGITNPDACHTVGVLMHLLENGRFLIRDVQRGQWATNVRERRIRQCAEFDGHSVTVAVEQEPGSGGKESALNTIRNLAGFKVMADRPQGDKVSRADPLSVQVNEGNVYIWKDVWNHAFVGEFEHFPFGKFKDQVDATSGAFAVLTGRTKRAGVPGAKKKTLRIIS